MEDYKNNNKNMEISESISRLLEPLFQNIMNMPGAAKLSSYRISQIH